MLQLEASPLPALDAPSSAISIIDKCERLWRGYPENAETQSSISLGVKKIAIGCKGGTARIGLCVKLTSRATRGCLEAVKNVALRTQADLRRVNITPRPGYLLSV